MYEHCCEMMKDRLLDNETALSYNSAFREYGLKVLDGGTSIIEIRFCPWCGKQLPESLRLKWIAEIESLGLEFGSRRIPAKYKDNTWWDT